MISALAGPTAVPTVHVEHCMGTVFSVRVAAPGVDPRVLTAAMDWLHAMDAMFSTYKPTSEISRLNSRSLCLPGASNEVRHVLSECERLEADTGGFFSARPSGMSLDPSGYVKGWAIQHIADMLAAAGSVNHCVNGGGDVVCAGRPEAGRGWRIGVSDPFTHGVLVTAVEAAGPVAVATSGLAERGAHILDPHTHQPVTDTASVTVVADDLIVADVVATAAVAMGPSRAADWLAGRPGVRALVVRATGELTWIGNWGDLTRSVAEVSAAG